VKYGGAGRSGGLVVEPKICSKNLKVRRGGTKIVFFSSLKKKN